MKLIFNKSPLSPTTIELTNVRFGYPGAEVFRGLNLSVTPGAVTALVGSNGSGKSTLLSLLAGVLRPHGGDVRAPRGDIALAVQRSAVTDDFPMTAAEAVMMGRWRRLGLLRRPSSTDHRVVDHWMTELGLDHLRRRTMGELSGGQRQRVLLAQAFVQEAGLLLLDEPTTGLDADSAAQVIAHLLRMASEGTTVVAATHDHELIRAAEHRIDLDATASVRELGFPRGVSPADTHARGER
ncbi:zinc ABC transporter ATP-binding protein AztA [Mycolicibacterium sp. GCM10028919]|uniref:zinc ABC transporter ATP-binding protein AztA n=1 Tax=Mycolicibacterium sp. GCM10028919 TaxID=3273401 RepID=UPI003616102E